MTEPRLEFVNCASATGIHRMAYWEWGDPNNDKVLLCVHGLTRCGRDFDELAQRLSSHYRVVCPDIVGRGRSDWLIDPAAYAVPQYISDMLVLIARLGVGQVDWLGTSMGGLIGLGLLAALNTSAAMRPDRGRHGLSATQNLRLGKVILNDIGPQLNVKGLARIATYVGQDKLFDSFADAVVYVQSVSASFGPHTPAQWERLTRYVVNKEGEQWVKHYDLRIAQAMAAQDAQALQGAELMLWAAYDAIESPILIIRGKDSDLLTQATASQMLERNSHASLVEFADVGHAPTLLTPEQIAPIESFLLAP